MSFLSQTFLFALPLALVPIALHLINRKQREVVNWGAMQFLTEASTKGSRYQRIEELLLLACRVGLVLALVLALARPLLTSSVLGAHPQRDMVLLLDNSLSTNLKVGNSASVFDQLKDDAIRVLDDLNPGDQVRVLLTAADAGWLQPKPVRRDGGGFGELKKRIASSQPTLAKSNVRQSLQTVLDSYVENPGQDLPRTIILLTDGQAEGWNPESKSAWQQLGKMLRSPSGGRTPVSLQVIFPERVEKSVANISVAEVSSRSSLVPTGEKIAFQARVINTGTSEQVGIRMHWTVDGEIQKESMIDKLSPGESREIEWSTRLESNGCVRVGCELDEESVVDHLRLDNSDQKIVEVTERIPILITRAAASYDTSNGHVFFSAALGYDQTESDQTVSDDSWRSVYEPTVVSFDELGDVNLADFHTVVLNDTTSLPNYVMDQLTEYVHGGGGLWVALGSRVDVTAFNANWYDEGTGLCPWKLAQPTTQNNDRSADVAETSLIHQPDPNHPATATLAMTSQVDLDDVHIHRRHTFSDEDEFRPISTLLETSRGEPLVVENAFGQGRVIVQTFPLGISWANLPLTRAYVVMIQDWLAYLTLPAATQYNLAPMASIQLSRLSAANSRSITVRPPFGDPRTLTSSELNSVSKFHYGRTQLPGCYEVDIDSNSGKSTHYFQVKRDVNESRIQQLTKKQREMLQACLGEGFGGVPKELTETVTASAALPAWSWLLIALLFLVVVEQLLASRLNQHRFGNS